MRAGRALEKVIKGKDVVYECAVEILKKEKNGLCFKELTRELDKYFKEYSKGSLVAKLRKDERIEREGKKKIVYKFKDAISP